MLAVDIVLALKSLTHLWFTLFTRTLNKWDSAANTGSLETRVNGITSNIVLFTDKPLFGYSLVASWLENIRRFGFLDITGTVLIGFSAFGIVFGTLLTYLFYRTCKCKDKLNTIVWFLVLMFSTLSQNLIIDNLFWILMFSGFLKEQTSAIPLHTTDSILMHTCH